MAAWYVNFGDGATTGYYAVAQWAALTAYNIGDLRRQLAAPAVGSERVWRCTTAGTSLAAEPSWTLTAGSTTTEVAGPVWTEVTGNSTYNWTAPHARLANALASGWGAAGDTFYIASIHAETQGSAMTLTSPGTAANPCFIYCVDHLGTVPPVSADLRATATITTTGANSISITTINAGTAYYYGCKFNCGTGAVTAALNVQASSVNGFLVFEACQFNILNTGTVGCIILGTSASASRVKWKNCVVTFSHTSQSIAPQSVEFLWQNTASAVLGTIPTNFITTGSYLSRAATIVLDGVDLSALGSGKNIFNFAASPAMNYLKDCKLGVGVSIHNGVPIGPGYGHVFVTRSDSAATNYRSEKYSYYGTQTTETTIVRSGGASDGTTPLSQKYVTTANTKWQMPFEAMPIAIWNPTTAANVGATLEGVWNSAVLPNNDELWFTLEYLGSSATPLGSFAIGTKADGLAAGAALTASTKAWDSLVTARANSTAYSLGDVRKVASNPGRIFFCTTAGTTAGSEPGGYASAVDGGSVTDNTAVFRAGMRFSQTVTASSPQPGMAGAMYIYPRVAKASSTFYIDPLVTLS
ncbi:MAG: hypothetical protein Q7N50_10835 [Armatimonadota bacterium]|nr:hypothetical protein [Armatimonadota bacterium]